MIWGGENELTPFRVHCCHHYGLTSPHKIKLDGDRLIKRGLASFRHHRQLSTSFNDTTILALGLLFFFGGVRRRGSSVTKD